VGGEPLGNLIKPLTCEVWEVISTVLCGILNYAVTTWQSDYFCAHLPNALHQIHLLKASIHTHLTTANYGR